MNRKLVYSPKFVRDSRKWGKSHPQDRVEIASTLQKLARDAFEPSLRTHKLKGDLGDSWSGSVRYDLRIVFEFADRNGTEIIHLLRLGSHDQAY